MPAKAGAWGIDIGQAGLKAIRLEVNDATDQIAATAFDFIAHPKILSQPDAIPEELIPQALEKFLKQNDISRDVVGISVPGQSALARFIQLPPVEASKVSEIVKYEAKQQIPFALEDVVWDYQTLGKGTEESGFLLEAEVGLFAMKRDQVMNHLKPFTNAGIEVELIQVAPLALYNFLSYDQLGIRLGDDAIAMDAYTILLDMGADNTTLLVSNGQKIWIRNVPIGGNHFTRALTKEMKLTFAKAEHLKCNATKSPDPRAVFQALRPVFNDYVSEIQRSIGYFSSVNRDAKINKVIGLGNGFKLAGLQKFLQQNLQYEVERIEAISGASPDAFKDAALFEENILSFPVCYGVGLQALKQTRIRTSLLPREISTARTITRKKPWAVVAAATLITALATSAFGFARVYRSVSKDRFGAAEEEVKKLTTDAAKLGADYRVAVQTVNAKKAEGLQLVRGLDRRNDWLELFKAVDECLPRDEDEIPDIRLQNRVRIFSVQTRFKPDLAAWYAGLNQNSKDLLDDIDKKTPPSGPGFVVTLVGEHWHDETLGKGIDPDPNKELRGRGEGYLQANFLRNLQRWQMPSHDNTGDVGVRTVGISHATIMSSQMSKDLQDPFGNGMVAGKKDKKAAARSWKRVERNEKRLDKSGIDIEGMRKSLEEQQNDQQSTDGASKWLEKNSFVVEFVWKPTSRPAMPAKTAEVKPAAPAPAGNAPAPGKAAPPAAKPAPSPAPAKPAAKT